jgi:hypothetical protein
MRALTASVVALLTLAGTAAASNLVTDSATNVRLAVSSSAALITYTRNGLAQQAYAWGAVNARFPSRVRPQVEFQVAYNRGHAAPGGCLPYDGPPLPWLVVACRAPDGSYWAVQSWRRRLPNYGLAPTPDQAVLELRVSHWKGPLHVFTVKQDWAYRRFHHLYGSVAYLGHPMYGFATTSWGDPTDRYGVLIYVDTFNSAYGAGWQRENSFVTHKPKGIFCYGFYPHAGHPPGRGANYRATVVGPGVLPDTMWSRPAVGDYNAVLDRIANEEQRRAYSDGLCRPN